MSLLDHVELSIVKGIGSTPSDTLSSEQPLTIVDLLTANSAFALVDWTPNIPSLKSGGIWADSSITDGRTLIAGVNTNVIETIVVQLTGSTIPDFASQFAKFQLLIQAARDFWDTFNQIEPVYIRWWANQAPGPQFALIYNIDMDVDWDDSNLAQAKLTLKIEREFGWRGVRPGGNPKEWTYWANTHQRGQWNANNASLASGTDHLAYNATVTNKAELSTGVAGYLNQNFIDIPAASVPGDLPALLNISVWPTNTSSSPTSLLIGKSTKNITGNKSRTTGANQFPIMTLNIADSSVQTDTTLAADAGACRPIGGGAAQRSQTTFVDPTMRTRVVWGSNQYTNGFDLSVMRGRYAVFLRARVSAAATCSIQLLIRQGASSLTLTPVTFSDLGAGGVGVSTDWGMAYLGQLNLPYNKRTDVSPNGLGVQVNISGASPLELDIQASRSAGAGVLYMCDLILMPIDEGVLRIVASSLVNTVRAWNYDNTGYYMHGGTEDIADILQSTPYEYDTPDWSSSGLILTPGILNRLMMLAYVDSTKRSLPADPTQFTVRVNIVPRWSGIRDA